MRKKLYTFCFVSLIAVLIFSMTQVQAKQYQGNGKVRSSDRNNNGVISHHEWTGTQQEFNRQDIDGDGVLGVGEFCQKKVVLDRFGEFDDNQDGYITRNEWNNTSLSYTHLDQNHDGRLNSAEFYDQKQYPVSIFGELDRNNNGRISRNEWRSTSEIFNRLDTNGNDYLSEREFYARESGNLIDQIFQEIFVRR
ncbi:MAG: hypothetical protein ACD_62C00124G0004 [uncultured bacterium]|nr:MAG: hypothetical protein ACD_62C00124G0004 [uncultured bacterium]